jgi:hypothetical protein
LVNAKLADIDDLGISARESALERAKMKVRY